MVPKSLLCQGCIYFIPPPPGLGKKRGKRGNFDCTLGKNIIFEKGGRLKHPILDKYTALYYALIYITKQNHRLKSNTYHDEESCIIQSKQTFRQSYSFNSGSLQLQFRHCYSIKSGIVIASNQALLYASNQAL